VRGIKLILAMMLSINLASAQNLTEQDWVGSTGLELSLMMESKGLHLLFSDSTLLSTRFDTEAEQIIDFLNINLNKVHLYAFEGLDCRCYVVSADPGFEVILPKKFFATQKTSETFSEDEDQNSLIRETRHTSVEQTLIIGQQGGGKSKGSCGISGYVSQAENGQAIFGATLYIDELKDGATTDENGFYTLQLNKGDYSIIVRSLEHEEQRFKLKVYDSGRQDFILDAKVYDLREVIVTADGDAHLERASMGIQKLSTKSVKQIPKILGETDLIKAALLLPGVQSVGEGSGGFNVRGSPADQNVFYLNHIPIYNTSHIFGFFTSFTPNAISDFTLYKSNFPTQYGGRLSSVFDVRAKKGNNQEFSMRGGISPITADVLVEGPISKGKSSYMAGVRTTYSDWVLNSINVPELNESSAQFRDAISTLNIHLGKNDRLNITGYYSYDDVSLSSLTNNKYQNLGSSVEWTHVIGNKHSLETIGSYSSYAYDEDNLQSFNAEYTIDYQIQHSELRSQFFFRPNSSHEVIVGVNSVLYELDQGSQVPASTNSLVLPIELGSERALESGLFINEEWRVSARWRLNGGIRFNHYMYLGPNDIYSYQPELPLTEDNITDTTSYNSWQPIVTYQAPDFRLSAKYSINEFMSVKAGFNQSRQYIILLTNTVALSPTDKWKLADPNIKPMSGKHYSVGYYSKFGYGTYEFSLEGYLKDINDLVEYRDGANLVVASIPETSVLQGDLLAYGAEIMLRKVKGKMNGWVSYAFARAIVRVDNELVDNRINYGIPYPANYDKPHAFNIVGNYKFTRRVSLSSTVVYATGRPVTTPTAVYFQYEIPLVNYSTRNEFRIPDYFRVDLGVNLEGNLKKKKLLHGSWNFSVYNLFGRRNAFSVFAAADAGHIQGYKLSIFGSPIVSVAYQFKLGSYEI
jgi:hypothetical protein